MDDEDDEAQDEQDTVKDVIDDFLVPIALLNNDVAAIAQVFALVVPDAAASAPENMFEPTEHNLWRDLSQPLTTFGGDERANIRGEYRGIAKSAFRLLCGIVAGCCC